MKKIATISLGLLVILFLTSYSSGSTLKVNTAKTATKEYFGAAKNIEPAGVHLLLGANYKAGDYLKFTLPTDFKYKNANTAFYLVCRTGAGGTYKSDTDADGFSDWSYFAGGNNTYWVQFRVNDDTPGTFLMSGNSWYISSVSVGNPTSSTLRIEVPTTVTASATGSAQNVSSESLDGISGIVFDSSTAQPFLTTYYEFGATINKVTSTIDVEQARKFFTAATGAKRSGANPITATRTTQNYSTTLAAADYFKHTVSGDMQGVSYVKCASVTNHPSASTTVVNVPVTDVLLFVAAHSGVVVVDGVTALNERTLTCKIEYAPAVASTYFGRTVLDTSDGWVWDTNGTVFRAAWLGTATNSDRYSAIRIANHSTINANIYADVYMDDGQKALNVLLGTVSAGGIFVMDGYTICKTKALLDVTDSVLTGGTWTGRIYLTVWAPRLQVFGIALYTAPTGYTQIPLEKQTPTGVTWWEK